MSTHQSFVDDVEAFLGRTGMKATHLGLQSIRDPNFVFSLRGGRSPSAKTMDRVREFMSGWMRAHPVASETVASEPANDPPERRSGSEAAA